ncbi:type II toxin-antitoxin system RatA family toxin [Marinomonas agarivorans]|nr:type II toxin-antitoxin system RatA family toxin [Marinomonas agarivorans]
MGVSQIERSAYVQYSCQQMYDLVNDIEAYVEFLPGCHRAELISHSDTEIVATLEIKKGPILQSFTTRNTLTNPSKVEMDLVKGPFKSLHGVWTFTELSATECKVVLNIRFELNGMLKLAFGGVFSQIAGTMVDAFCQRANQVYGQ